MRSSQADCSFINKIEEVLQKEDTQNTLSELALTILEFEMSNSEPENDLCQRGLSNENNALNRIFKVCKKDTDFYIMALTKEADKRLKAYQFPKHPLNHRHRRQYLEDIIRILQPAENEINDSRFLTLLARVYLYRGLLYRPKGRTVAARKTEAIKKAVRLAEKAIQDNMPEKEAAETWRVWAYAALELERADSSFITPLEKLKTSALFINNGKIRDLNDAIVIVEYAERSSKGNSFLKSVSALDEKDYWKQLPDFFLLKAKASFLSNQTAEALQYLESAIHKAPKAFAAPFWDDLVNFLKKLAWDESQKKIRPGEWKNIAVLAYERCRNTEAEITSNIFLRWYWARQKDLYDLAFLAADSPEKKAEIADSLKSRPVLRYQALNDLKGKIKGIDSVLDREDESRDERYLKIPKTEKGKEKVIQQELKTKSVLSFQKLAVPWVAVHFYLNELEEKGYGLIFDSVNKKWKERKFNYRELHKKFLEWQQHYYSENKDACSDSLVKLCCEIGKTMPFLFDGTFPAKSRILWIPHGFLHRLPFHAAVSGGTVFSERHISAYIPAWHLLNENRVQGKGQFLIKRLRPDDRDAFSNLNNSEWENKENNEIPKATDKHLANCMKSHPEILVILCHGHGDILNPFKSWMELENSRISVLDILKSEAELSGTRILLGACESDMAPPAEFIIDEHLSLSTVFLSHNAREIIAGLWKINNAQADRLYNTVLHKTDILAALNKWQEKEISMWKKHHNNNIFYMFASFRVMGFPYVNSSDSKESQS
ncbi:MAG: CHAT domain-containing protein [Desulfobacteraceae bacterium]|nr:CHAT domain-containing protein [Desulfobacteraceae bacterium]